MPASTTHADHAKHATPASPASSANDLKALKASSGAGLLPQLVGGLQLTSSGDDRYDFSSTFLLIDTFTGRHFRLGETEAMILAIWDQQRPSSFQTLIQRVQASSPSVPPDTIEAFVGFAIQQHLTIATDATARNKLDQMVKTRHAHWLNWILHSYLFFRWHLWDPSRALPYLVRWSSFLYRPWWGIVMSVLGVATFLGVLVNGQRFLEAFVATFSPRGLLLYLATVPLVKLAHELGHAVTAHRLGCKVNSMGIAFMVLWPIPFTNANDTWRLSSRWDRVRVDIAGILIELQLCVIAAAWWLLNPSAWYSPVLVAVITTTFIGTLLINLNPLMRFDGYFLASDLLGVENFGTVANRAGQMHLRHIVFGMAPTAADYDILDAHQALTRQQIQGLALFAWTTWMYRLFLFAGIAWLVYHLFLQPLGFALAMVEIGYFIARPIGREMWAWWMNRRRIRWSRAGISLALIFFSLLSILLIPLPGIPLEGVVKSRVVSHVFSAHPGMITRVFVQDHDTVTANDLLLETVSPALTARASGQETITLGMRQAQERSSFAVIDSLHWLSLKERTAHAEALLASEETERGRLLVRAPIGGHVRDVNPSLSVGAWIDSRTLIATIVQPDQLEVVAYVESAQVTDLTVGAEGTFYFRDGHHRPMRLRIATIGDVSTRVVSDPAIVSLYGGGFGAQRMTHSPQTGELLERPLYLVDRDITMITLIPQNSPIEEGNSSPSNVNVNTLSNNGTPVRDSDRDTRSPYVADILSERAGWIIIDQRREPLIVDLWKSLRRTLRIETFL